MNVFVDTTAFLALLDARHSQHKFLRDVFALELEADATLVVTNYVVLETFDVLRRRLGVESLRLFARELLPACDIVWVQPADHALAVEMLLACGPKPPTLVDCTSFVVARRLGVSQCMALDERFAHEGLEPIC
jgi:predicted nucleic acid-binding protein